MISKDKTYRTRDGREVRIYATDGAGERPIHAAYRDKDSDQWWVSVWSINGCYASAYDLCDLDLIEVKPRHKRTVWLNVYDHGPVIVYREEKTAAVNRMDGCLACIKVDLDFQEGEGL